MAETFNPFETPDTKEPISEDWAAKRRVADATRRLISNLYTSTDSAAELYKIADQIDIQADALARSQSLYGMTAFERADEGKHGTRFRLGYEMHPVFGKCNPVAPHFNIWIRLYKRSIVWRMNRWDAEWGRRRSLKPPFWWISLKRCASS